MVVVHLANYKYKTLVVAPKNNNNEYKTELDEYIKETIMQNNAIKLNNFGKHYKTYGEAFK